MRKDKFPEYDEIPWNDIKEIRVTSDGGSHSFEFEISGKKQLMTITIAQGQTTFTLSGSNGVPIVNATQKGREIRIMDFEKKLRLKSAE